MRNLKPDFLTVIKTSIPSITKHPRNISPSIKRNTNQGRITFKPDISKPHVLSFLHSMYNSIKLSNYTSLNVKKHKESTNKHYKKNANYIQIITYGSKSVCKINIIYGFNSVCKQYVITYGFFPYVNISTIK